MKRVFRTRYFMCMWNILQLCGQEELFDLLKSWNIKFNSTCLSFLFESSVDSSIPKACTHVTIPCISIIEVCSIVLPEEDILHVVSRRCLAMLIINSFCTLIISQNFFLMSFMTSFNSVSVTTACAELWGNRRYSQLPEPMWHYPLYWAL